MMKILFYVNNNRISESKLEDSIGVKQLAVLLSEAYANVVREIEHFEFHNEEIIFGCTKIYYYKTINGVKITVKIRI